MIVRSHPPGGRGKVSGQSLPEFLVVVPVFLFLILLIFQLVLIYRAKTTLDYATLEAARRGAVHGASIAEMHKGLAQGMTPLYATEADVTGVALAYGKAREDLRINSGIEVISPRRATWNAHKERQYDGSDAIPNDSLSFRARDIRGGEVNVQDANLLKIRVTYHYPLVVPFVDLVLRGRSNYVPADGLLDPANVPLRHPLRGGPWMGNHYRIELEAHAVVRMQSPIRDAANLK